MISAAPMSTIMLAFMNLVYGKLIARFRGDGVRISSAVMLCRTQAFGFSWATSLKRDHRPETRARCPGIDSPRWWRMALSYIGYTWIARRMPLATSYSWCSGFCLPITTS